MFFQRSLMFAVLLLSLLAQPIASAEQDPKDAKKEKEKEKADPTEKVTLQYRVSKDAFAPSSFVAVINGNITLRLEIRWDLPEAAKKDKKEFDDLIKKLEEKVINGVEFECKGEWVKKGLILRVTTVPQITAEGKKRMKGP